jgi:putative DNA primase/helicase
MADQPKWQELGFPDLDSYLRSGYDSWAKDEPAYRIGSNPEAGLPPPDKRGKRNGKSISLAHVRSEEWVKLCQGSDHGYRPNEYNAAVMLEHAPEFAGAVFWNSRRLCPELARATPAGLAGPWSDAKTAQTVIWAQGAGLQLRPKTFETALLSVAQRNPIDPLGDYLEELKWDGQERIGTWLSVYCGAEQTETHSLFGSKFLIGAVARALTPGCRMDYMLVLEGPQGIKKSTAVKILGGEWTAENLPDMHSKDAQMAAGGFWFLEISELGALNRSAVEQAKAFLTRTADSYRPPFGRHFITAPRWCVCIGNVNPDSNGYLRDTTGNRRYWPVRVGQIDSDALTRDRDQLFAEAVYCFNRGDPWWIENSDQTSLATEAQEERLEMDDWQCLIADWLNSRVQVGQVTTLAIAIGALEMHKQDVSRAVQTRIGNCLSKLGYVVTRQSINGIRERRYLKLE